jgi:hypothetical protein
MCPSVHPALYLRSLLKHSAMAFHGAISRCLIRPDPDHPFSRRSFAGPASCARPNSFLARSAKPHPCGRSIAEACLDRRIYFPGATLGNAGIACILIDIHHSSLNQE